MLVIKKSNNFVYFSVDKTKNRCPVSYRFSFLQNNWCCSTNEEGTTSLPYFKKFCNGGNLDDASICCEGESIECPNKPCFNYVLNPGKNFRGKQFYNDYPDKE